MGTRTPITDPTTPAPPSFQVERVSVASDGTQANAGSFSFGPSISADGRFVTYDSDASNLVPGDTNGASDVFLFDRQTDTTTRVSVASDGAEGNSSSFSSSISADGRFVTYSSAASTLVPGDTNGTGDIFVFDRQTDTTERVSLASDGTEGNGFSGNFLPDISANGRYVTYVSWASNLVPGDTNGASDVFVFDRQTDTTERVSLASDGTEGNFPSQDPEISADGRFVTYSSFASNLVPGDTNGSRNSNLGLDIFVFDRQTNTTMRLSVASDGTQGNHRSDFPSISADGRFVTYTSQASNSVPGDTNAVEDIFVLDRQTDITTRVSVASDGTEADSANLGIGSFDPSISADGRYVTYYSYASNLVPDDTNGIGDIFVFDRQTGTTERVSVASDGTQGEGGNGSLNPAISADGRSVAYFSEASNLVPGDTNNSPDIFVTQTAVAPPADGVVKDGDEGNNVLKGTRRDDILRGHGGKDWLFGGKGDDSLDGGAGKDKIFGGKGDDTVLGGAGNDRIFTGKGSDLVIFNEGDGQDWVFDFDQRCRETDPRFDRVQLDVSIGTNAIDDFAELQALIASGDIGLSTQHHSPTLTFDNGDAMTLRGVRELSADDWLFIDDTNLAGFTLFNGHYYDFVPQAGVTYEMAKQGAADAGGYLATVTSAAENQFLYNLMSSEGGTFNGWLGGSDATTEGTWQWTQGSPEAETTFWTGLGNGSAPDGQYTNWNTGEPNDAIGFYEGGEDALRMLGPNSGRGGLWNDASDSPFGDPSMGYFVEI